MAHSVERSAPHPFIWLVLLLLTGCGGLPEYAAPRIYAEETSLPPVLVHYRDLTIGDFQAEKPPDFLAGHVSDLNAHTAVALRTVPGAQYTLTPPNENSRGLPGGRISNLAFEAVMLPAYSWWSPTLSPEKYAYVLQHEQIHFALMEIAARRLNQRLAGESVHLSVTDTNHERVQKRLLDTVDRMLADSKREVLREHTEFDEATSRRYDPEVQLQWYGRVNKELRETAGHD